MLRVRELLSKSQMTAKEAVFLDNELKAKCWQDNKYRFLSKLN